MVNTHFTIAQRKVRIIFICGTKFFYSDLQTTSIFLPIALGIEMRSYFSEGLFCSFWPQEEYFYIELLRPSSQQHISKQAYFHKSVIQEKTQTQIPVLAVGTKIGIRPNFNPNFKPQFIFTSL